MIARSPASAGSLHLGFALVALAFGQLGCGTEPTVLDPPLFPADYATTYQEVLSCRYSLEHDQRIVRVFGNADAMLPYTGRAAEFPTGAKLVKEEYGEDDDTCSEPIVTLTVMQKLDVGFSPKTIDWRWQEVGPDHRTTSDDPTACVRCHEDCEGGYLGTCGVR